MHLTGPMSPLRFSLTTLLPALIEHRGQIVCSGVTGVTGGTSEGSGFESTSSNWNPAVNLLVNTKFQIYWVSPFSRAAL